MSFRGWIWTKRISVQNDVFVDSHLVVKNDISHNCEMT